MSASIPVDPPGKRGARQDPARGRDRAIILEPDGEASLLEFQSPTASLIVRPVPFSARTTTWLIFALVVTTIAVMMVFPIDRVVTAQARVVAMTSNLVVQPLETAIVRSIDVREGQLVHAGDLLAQLDPTFATADATGSEAQTVSLQAEVDRLQAEQGDRPYLGDGTPQSVQQASIYAQRHAERTFKIENYRQKIDGARVKVDQAQSDIASFTQRLSLATQVENKRRELERLQVGSQLNTMAAADQRVEVARSLEGARASLETAHRELDALVAERDGFVQTERKETSQQLTEQSRKLAEARGNSNKAGMRRKLVDLRVDRDAIVLSIAPVSVGSVMQSGEEFFKLVPVDAPVEIEASVSGRDAGFVRVNDRATVKFDTFAYTQYGYFLATVRFVSADSFSNPDQQRKPQRPGPPSDEGLGPVFYRARLTLGESKMRNLPADFRVTPGMPVTADIKVGERTIMGYLLSRVLPTAQEALREP